MFSYIMVCLIAVSSACQHALMVLNITSVILKIYSGLIDLHIIILP